MAIKFYFTYIDKELIPLPSQLSNNDYLNSDWKFSKNLLNIIPEDDFQLLGEVDLEHKEVITLLKRIEIPDLISSKMKADIKQENDKFFDNLSNSLKFSSHIQKPDDLFISHLKWALIHSTLEAGKYPLIIGPKGTGKTLLAYKLAEAMNRKLYPINCGSLFKPKQSLVGSLQAKEGSTFIVPSEFLESFSSNEPTLIFLNEISRIPSAAANYLMTATDRLQSYIYIEDTGKRVYKGKDVLFIADANFGYEYSDTRNLDGAFFDRFIKFTTNYLPENEEVDLIKLRVSGLENNTQEVKMLVSFANMCRAQIEKLKISVSTRQLIDIAGYFTKGFSFKEIIDEIFVNLFYNGMTDEREAIIDMFKSKF